MRTVARRGFFAAWLGLVAAGCLSPTLPPLPPPSAPSEMAYLGQKRLQLAGRLPTEGGLVFALNLATDEVGGQQFRNGRYSFVVPAQPGDAIELWYVVGRDQSELLRFLAPQYPPVSDGDSGDSGGQAGADAGPALGSGDADATGAGARALDAATDAF